MTRQETATSKFSTAAAAAKRRRRLARLIKDAALFVYLYSGYVPLRDGLLALLGRSRVVVLCYHRIGLADVLTKPPADFRRELAYLKRNFECIGFGELCARLRDGRPFRKRAAVITFDDGYRDNYLLAVPALREFGLTATFFVSTGFIGTTRVFPHDEALAAHTGSPPKMSWDDLRAMEAEGFEIGSHTVEHTDLGRADEATIEREIRDSLAKLNDELGRRERAFAFPWGKPQNIPPRAAERIERAGYYAAASAYGFTNTRGASLFNIRRSDAGNGELSWLAVRARVAGFDPDAFRLKLRRRSPGRI
jgi:peptidoglycan/xylan/chitin deacetylase (PgdA/CDA1 family)